MKCLRLIGLVVALIVLGELAIEIYRSTEPHYQWRALSDWIEDGRSACFTAVRKNGSNAHFLEYDHDFQAASHAVKEIGPEAIPWLLRWAQAKDSPLLKSRAVVWLSQQPFCFRIESADYYHIKAYYGFMLLGKKAKPAWPLLIEWTRSPDRERRLSAFECLVASTPDDETIMPVIERLIHDPDKGIQLVALNQNNFRFPPEPKTNVLPYPGVPTFTNQPTDAKIAWGLEDPLHLAPLWP